LVLYIYILEAPETGGFIAQTQRRISCHYSRSGHSTHSLQQETGGDTVYASAKAQDISHP